MPVTSRIHVIESGSAKKPIFTLSVPAGTHVKRLWTLTAQLAREVEHREEHHDRPRRTRAP